MSLARPTTLLSLTAVVLSLPALAQAQDKDKADLQVLVAQVSTKGTEVAPELKAMAADFKRNGLAFTNYKLVSKASLALKLNESKTVKMPNGVAKLTLQKMAGAKASVRIEPPGIVLEMTPGGETYLDAGSHAGDKVFLAVKR